MIERRSPTAAQRLSRPVAAFIRTESSGGIGLLLATVVAVGWANSPWDAAYHSLWTTPARLRLGPVAADDLRGVVGNVLMILFFAVIGLEVKREVRQGDLGKRETALLPVLAALGGMALPALLYTAVNAGRPGGRGWAVPMATDIAFSLGLLSLLGRRVPTGLKVFLLTLAVVDDIVTVVVLAVAYPGSAAHLSPAIVGVTLGVLVPWRALVRAEGALHPIVALVVVPLFALSHAGVTVGAGTLEPAGAGRVAGGVLLARLVGKPLGIVAVSLLAVRAGAGRLPAGVATRHLVGVGLLAGVGFTVPLYASALAFTSPALQDAVTLAVLAATIVGAVAGLAVLRFSSQRDGPAPAGSRGSAPS